MNQLLTTDRGKIDEQSHENSQEVNKPFLGVVITQLTTKLGSFTLYAVTYMPI